MVRVMACAAGGDSHSSRPASLCCIVSRASYTDASFSSSTGGAGPTWSFRGAFPFVFLSRALLEASFANIWAGARGRSGARDAADSPPQKIGAPKSGTEVGVQVK